MFVNFYIRNVSHSKILQFEILTLIQFLLKIKKIPRLPIIIKVWKSFLHEKKIRHFHVRKLKIMWNFQKNGLEKMFGWMCVRLCVETSKNSNVCISGISQRTKLKLCMEVEPKCYLFHYNFRQNWSTYWHFFVLKSVKKVSKDSDSSILNLILHRQIYGIKKYKIRKFSFAFYICKINSV